MRPRPSPSGLTAVLPLLACPHCTGGLELLDRSVVGCRNGHRFDVARQGYLSLLGGRSRTDTADSADMVAARIDFLAAGHYRPIAGTVAALSGDGPLLEIGAGTGYYLAAALDLRPGTVGIALDASGYAARRAAATHARIGSIVADAWSRLPVRDAAAGTVLSVFAPRDAAEVDRVLTRDGRLVVVTPEPEHLEEIRGVLGLLTVDAGKPERLAEAFRGRLSVIDRRPVREVMALPRHDVSALVRMGPSARHLGPENLAAAVAALPETTAVTLSVTVSVLGRSEHPGSRGRTG